MRLFSWAPILVLVITMQETTLPGRQVTGVEEILTHSARFDTQAECLKWLEVNKSAIDADVLIIVEQEKEEHPGATILPEKVRKECTERKD
jgi:hypothetical protein